MQNRNFTYVIFAIAVGALAIFIASRQTANPISLPVQKPPVIKKTPVAEKATNPDLLFGYIDSIRKEGGKVSIEFDLAQLFTAQPPDSASSTAISADMAMHDDGKCTDENFAVPGGCSPNSFYIRNNDASTQQIELSGQLQVLSMHYVPSGKYEGALAEDLLQNRPVKVIRLQEFESVFAALNEQGTGTDARSTFSSAIPYHLTLKDGKVIKMEEQLTP